MIDFYLDTKYRIEYTSKFKKQLRKILKQKKDEQLLLEIITKLANLEELEPIYKNHNLINNRIYKDCSECHLKPDWLLVYKYIDDKLVLLLFSTGTHSDLF